MLQDDFNNDIIGITQRLKMSISYRKKVGGMKIHAGCSYLKRGILLVIKMQEQSIILPD